MIRIEQAHLSVMAGTHPGMSGKNNEDRFAVTAFQVSESDPTPVLLAVLCDGIGGHRAGEIAAEIAVNVITQRVADSDGSSPVDILFNAIQEASEVIYKSAQVDETREGMGATVACAWVHGNQLYTATVGDSRIYLVRGGSIRQLSVDHTWVQEALEMGVLHPNQVNGHPNAHVIRRYLGSPEPPEVDLRMRLARNEADSQAVANQGVQLRPGDRLLLCSDGLTDLVSDAEILSILQRTPLSHAPEALTALANQRGGHDNITIITMQVKGEKEPGHHFLFLRQIPLLIVFGLLVAALLTYYVMRWVRQLGEQVVPTATPTVSLLLEATELPTVPTPTFAPTLTPVVVGTPSLQVEETDQLQTPAPLPEMDE